MFQFVFCSDGMTRFRFAAIASLALMSVGCGKSETDMAKVTGRVTYKNAPVAGAVVMFVPTTKGAIAMGTTNMNGEYKLMTGSAEGCAIGPATVTIEAVGESNDKRGQFSRPTNPEDMQKAQETMKRQMMGAGNTTKAAGHSLLPAKYADAKSSGLTADVKPSGISADFDLQ